jgi:hypothetical protein
VLLAPAHQRGVAVTAGRRQSHRLPSCADREKVC